MLCRTFSILLLCVAFTRATLSPKNRKSASYKEEKVSITKAYNKEQNKTHNKSDIKQLKGPQSFTVFDKNLVVENVHSNDILKYSQAFFEETDEHSFEGLVLGYVTPWNNHGYDVAKIFGNKFTHISPVWLQIKRLGTQKYEVTGTHDVDKEWVATVKNAGRQRKLKMVPRILFEGWSKIDFVKLLENPDEKKSLAKTLIQTCNKYNFDGFVVELWSLVAGHFETKLLENLIIDLGDSLALGKLQIILVIPPKRGEESSFSSKSFDALYDHVTAFSLMTYDFPNGGQPGPNAPIYWVEDCIKSLTSDKKKRSKILTGLNFYGNDYTLNEQKPIIFHDYLKKLKSLDGELKWNQEIGEHWFDFTDENDEQHLVFYPTLRSITLRMKLSEELGTGISIWELGQGLDYFYDLL